MHDLVSNLDSELAEWSLGGLMNLDILHLISRCPLMIMPSFIPATGTSYYSLNTHQTSDTEGLLHHTHFESFKIFSVDVKWILNINQPIKLLFI